MMIGRLMMHSKCSKIKYKTKIPKTCSRDISIVQTSLAARQISCTESRNQDPSSLGKRQMKNTSRYNNVSTISPYLINMLLICLTIHICALESHKTCLLCSYHVLTAKCCISGFCLKYKMELFQTKLHKWRLSRSEIHATK